MSDWTLGAVKERNMEIVALCEEEGCKHLFVFNLDMLIEGVGPGVSRRRHSGHALSAMRGVAARHSLSFADPPAEAEEN